MFERGKTAVIENFDFHVKKENDPMMHNLHTALFDILLGLERIEKQQSQIRNTILSLERRQT